ncbi:MAG: SOS response-associated peptidase [Chloroflexi bacterium]|nr:SOS response-associated peptidase [Chloroflexota bacterium]
MCTAIDLYPANQRRWDKVLEDADYSIDYLVNKLVDFENEFEPLEPLFNLRITDPIPVIPNTADQKLTFFRFGLIPHWAKDEKIGNKLFNARAETIGDKPSFRVAIRRQRCLIVVTGFYEWPKVPKGQPKIPYRIFMKNRLPFALAGIWESWKSPSGQLVETAAIITTEPNDLIHPYHHRMPVIVSPEMFPDWLSMDEQEPQKWVSLFRPYPDSEMDHYQVSPLLNNTRNKLARTVVPIKD